MAASFDAYHKWLGIPPAEQPPHHYRLLGLSPFESDPDVIEIAADQRMALLRSFHAGPHSDLTQKLLNEVAAARLCLLKPDRRAVYNEHLRRRLAAEQGAAPAAPNVQSAAPDPVSDPATDSLPDYYEHLRQHLEHAPPEVVAPDLLSTLVPVEPPRSPPVVPVKPVRPVNPAPLADPVVPPPRVAGSANATMAKAVASSSSTAATTSTAGVKSSPSAPRVGPQLPAPSAAWDQAIEEACAAETNLQRRRRHWQVSGDFIQVTVGAVIIAGLIFGGLKAFTMWEDADARRFLLAAHSTQPSKTPPDPAPAAESTAADTQPTTVDPPVPQAVPSEPNDPNLGDARSVAGRFGLPQEAPPAQSTPAPASTAPPVPADNSTPPAVVRTPVPKGDDWRKSSESVNNEIRDETQHAVGPSGRSALAHKLAEKAEQTTDDPAKRYVLAKRALELAVKLCDIHLASDLVGGLSAHYDDDSWALRLTTLQRLAQSAPNRETHEVIAEAALNLVEPALTDEHYESAKGLATLSMNLATNLRNFSLRDQAREDVDRLKQIQRWLSAVDEAKYRLEADPTDAGAHLVIGEFKSMLKQDWQGGLANLQAAGDKQFGALVQKELSPPPYPAEQAQLADAWWDLAESRQDSGDILAVKAMRSRAVHWYRLAMPNLTDLALVAKAKKRCESL